MTFLKHYSRLSKIKTQRAITLIELLVIIAIMAVLSTLSNSWYSGYIETARVNTAISQISALSLLIDDYILENGEPPSSLADVSNHNLIDPWGNPYEYLKLDLDNEGYAKTGIWQMGGGFMAFSMVSLNILSSSGKSESDREDDKNDREDTKNEKEDDRENDKNDREDTKDNRKGGKKDPGGNNGGSGSNGGDGNDGGSSNGGGNNNSDNSNNANNDNDSSGNENSAQTKARKDYSMVPLNTDYDLFSRGKDGISEPPLPATASQDDVLRANNGGFIGLASTF